MDPYSEKAENTIRHHMIWSMGAGFIPLPLADLFSVSAIQLNLIRRLCKIYEVDFREEEGKAIITALTSSALAKLGARTMIKLFRYLVVWSAGLPCQFCQVLPLMQSVRLLSIISKKGVLSLISILVV